MKLVRLVKSSDLKNVEHLVKNSGAGMTTMPKTSQEIKKRLLWSERSQKKNIKKLRNIWNEENMVPKK